MSFEEGGRNKPEGTVWGGWDRDGNEARTSQALPAGGPRNLEEAAEGPPSAGCSETRVRTSHGSSDVWPPRLGKRVPRNDRWRTGSVSKKEVIVPNLHDSHGTWPTWTRVQLHANISQIYRLCWREGGGSRWRQTGIGGKKTNGVWPNVGAICNTECYRPHQILCLDLGERLRHFS